MNIVFLLAATSKSMPALSTGVDFVNKHRRDLIQRVSAVQPILDLLFDEGALSSEEYADLRAEPNCPKMMRELFILLDKRGAKAKRLFYKGLEENEKFLMEDLNEQG